MMPINVKIENKFKKEFTNMYVDTIFKRNPYLADKIKRALQEAYDLGHADGIAEGMRETCNLF